VTSAGNNTLSEGLREAILNRLGIPHPPPADLDGLRTIYRAWCKYVPFDNIGKVISLRTGAGALHGIYAVQFFESWLAEGNGATCWPSANALYELLHSLGFAARRVAGHMLNIGILNHGSAIVLLGENAWLADSSMLTDVPLPLGRKTFVARDPVFASEVEFDAGRDGSTHIVWTQSPPNVTPMPCRILPEAVTHGEYLQRYEATRERSPFNSRLYARRNRASEMLVLIGNKRCVKSRSGVEIHELSRDEVLDSLRTEFSLRPSLLHRWVAAGGLDSAFEEYSGPSFPPETRKPPSQRD
jgi:N-hydroxyarylamine O-acetyltransferase